ncbi:Cytochrome p450, partial [Thalictrum thalictroides]
MMEVPLSWLFCTATLLTPLILVYFLAFYLRLRLHRVNLPPGPKPWPIIGNLNLIGSLPHRSIHELSQVYGPIMQLRFGSFPVVVGSSVEIVKQFLKVHDIKFASRPNFSAGKYTTYDYTDVGWSPYGPYWRHIRKICLAELLNTKKVDSYEYIRVEEGRALISSLYTSCGKSITIKDHYSNFTLNNITRMVLGKKFWDENESEDLAKIADEWFFLNGAMNIGDSIPWINFLDLQGFVKRMKAFRNKVDPILERELDEHIARRLHDQHMKNKFVPKDMVDVLLQQADDPNPDLKLSHNKIKSITLDLIVGGVTGATTTIEWAMSELLKHPTIAERATDELDRRGGDPLILCFVDFLNPACAATALSALQAKFTSQDISSNSHCSHVDVNPSGYKFSYIENLGNCIIYYVLKFSV